MDILKQYTDNFNIAKDVVDFCNTALSEIGDLHSNCDEIAEFNQLKVINAMQKKGLNVEAFSGTTGYGYNDTGREMIEDIYSDIFSTEDTLLRPQLMSGTHALSVSLFGNLRHGDELISPVGTPYDTLLKVIGIKKSRGSLIDHGIIYKQVDLLPNETFDYAGIEKAITTKTKMVTVQRSKGYSFRHSLTVKEIGKLISFIKNINHNIICMVDNCYGEFVDYIEPSQVGADMVVGSLIKNPGGGLAPTGGYISGKAEYVENGAIRLSAPGLGKDIGATLSLNASTLQGLFLAPSVVCGSVKGAIFASRVYEKLGFLVSPKSGDIRSDIVQGIRLGSAEGVLKFCEGIQKAAPVDSYVTPVGGDMPGYDVPIIMACGSFVQGSSIELSADGPLKEPFNVYLQGGLTWHHAKLGVIMSVQALYEKGLIKL